jgi:hypothetical protein
MRLLTTVSLIIAFTAACSAAEVNWHPQDFQAAAQRAQQEGKLIYIFVEGSNCPPCDSFKFSHLNDPVFTDFINSLFIPIRAHEGQPDGSAFLQSLRLVHGAVPRFYVLSPEGRGVSMSIGAVTVPPSGAIDMMKMATGRDLPVNRAAAEQVAQRIRAFAAGQRQAGALSPDGSDRDAAIAAVEAWAWALGGRLDEAERAWGGEWADRMQDQELRYAYVNFWAKWNRNPAGALRAAQLYQASVSAAAPSGPYLLGMALAANGRYEEAIHLGETLMNMYPDNTAIQNEIDRWRNAAGMSRGSMLYSR